MTPSEIYGMLRWTSQMRDHIQEAIEEFEFKLKGLLKHDPLGGIEK